MRRAPVTGSSGLIGSEPSRTGAAVAMSGAPRPPGRVNWILNADRGNICSRLHGWHIHEYLTRVGVASRLLSAPPFPLGDAPWGEDELERVARLVEGEIVVLQKLAGPNAEALREALRGRAFVVYAQGDYELENPLPLRCDAVICSARWLADWHRDHGVERSFFVPDPAEFWCDRAEITGEARRPGQLILSWFGHRATWPTLEPLREVLAEPGFEDFRLVTVSNRPDADIQWSFESWMSAVSACDIGVVPTRPPPVALGKSSNRVVQLMAAGKPVVAGNTVPSYRDVLRNGWNGFLCESAEDWRHALRALRDPALRRDFALRGYDTVFPRYKADTVAAEWLEVLRAVAPPSTGSRSAHKLEARVELEARRTYASEALRLNLGVRIAGREIARGLTAAPAAAGGAGAGADLVLTLAPTFLRRLAEAVVQRARGLLSPRRREVGSAAS